MTEDKITTPSSSGGLVNYNEASKSNFQLSPETVTIIIAIVVVAMTAIKIFLK